LQMQLERKKETLYNWQGVLQKQNEDLDREVTVFVEEDEVMRAKLDRRDRVQGTIQKFKNAQEQSAYRVREVRSPRK
jgi:hypothetical protein